MRYAAIVAAVLTLTLPAFPAAAQSGESPVAAASEAADPYAALVDAIRGGVSLDAQFEQLRSQMRGLLLSADSETSALEKDHPGIVEQILEAITPVLIRHAQRIAASDRLAYVELFRTELSVDDVRQAAAFYGSPLGQHLIQTLVANVSVDATMREALASDAELSDEGDISAQAIRADHAASTRRAVAALSPAELEQIAQQLRGQAWLLHLNLLQPRMLEIATRSENAPFNPEDAAAIDAAVDAVVRKRVAEAR